MIELVIAMSLMGNPVPKYRVLPITPIKESEVVGSWIFVNKAGADGSWTYTFTKDGMLTAKGGSGTWYGQWRLAKDNTVEIEEWMDTWKDENGVLFNFLSYSVPLRKTKKRDIWEVLPGGKPPCYGDGHWRRVQ